MARYKKKRALLTPDLTPLIDVVFLLLIFFIVSTTFNKYGNIDIDLPTSTLTSEENDDKNLEIIIDKDNRYFITFGNKKNVEITFDEIDYYLNGAKSVSITGDKDLKYQNIIDIITKVKKHGIENLGINFYE
ncbi:MULTISPECIES: ExbD/TolR family protein [Fusobacterium]|jgi:biopolymer transport protein ExbD|uniref:Biopolymer transporter ExbD n=1 Tax=Fusobacterium varium ATCC 27725 TaxID=469618 RepID=A0ABM6U603_FUSVA|nr:MULTISPECIES: biopolymer transporter ExbD [Fusobacterium]AVQ31833.1 biopolymer transporter ExbD [Fusobacterium varium ATCC 27725]EES63188.1 transport energizing protein, ExbD/TolR family [Fusobacterium varium ATCC 27725]MCF0171511.1 biopolymer transporter ExbD [Fusobacterium varium]MCF2672327.1 biopolymer transporter ExbD [Fusobacterium varium]MCI6033854.1 biopolymer transporter ExbD [Fusobacterium varium]